MVPPRIDLIMWLHLGVDVRDLFPQKGLIGNQAPGQYVQALQSWSLLKQLTF